MKNSLQSCLQLISLVIVCSGIVLATEDGLQRSSTKTTYNDHILTDENAPKFAGSYVVVVAPRSIRSNSKYTVSLSTTGAVLPIRFRLKIIEREEQKSNQTKLYYTPNSQNIVHDPHDFISTLGPSNVLPHPTIEFATDSYSEDNSTDAPITFVQQKSVTVNPGEVEMIDFTFDKHIPPGSYQLEVKSLTNAFPFHDSRFLYVESKTHSLFIQTNKVLYKPGDVVKYRVLVLDADTKPVRVENGLKISISDASQNVIQQIDRQNALQGIFRGEFELSKDEKFGKWNIEAEFMDKRYQKTIEVAGYVSPKFQVTIRTPTFVARTTKTFSIFVEAKYVFGKPVRGTMTLKVTPIFKTKNSWSKIGRPHVIISDIHGKYVADVHSHDLIVARNQSHSGILVETTVEDKASGLIGCGKDKVIAVETGKNRTKFDIQVTNFRFLLPGAHFFTTIHVKSKNGQPIPAKSSFVKFQSAFELIDHSQNVTAQTYKLDANGKVDVKIDVPSVPTRNLKIDVRYLYAHEEVYIQAKPLHVQVATTKPKLNQVVRFQVGSMKKLNTLSFYVVGRGNILLSKTVSVDKKNVLVLEFETTFEMLPQATLVVFYVTEDGTIVSDHTEVLFSQEIMPNMINISVSKNKLRPKHELIIKVKKDKDSHLGLTLIDQSTLLMRQGGDLTKKQIFNDLQKYDNAGSFEMEMESQMSDAYVNLLEPGVVVLSNALALKGRFNASGLEKARLAAGHPLSYTADILADFIIPVMPTCNIEDLDEASQKELRNTEIVRNTFPEVVLWEDFTDGENVTVIKTQLPDSMTSWALSGYSLSSELGLGITKSPLILTVFKPFFIEANVPYSAVRGDLVTMVVSVHNYFNQKVRVEVMIDKSDDFEIIADGRNLPDYSSYEDNDYEQKNEEQNIIYVQAEDVKSTLFTLRTKTVGQIPIIVRATSEIACDAVQQNLLVKPEGITVTRSQSKSLVITPATKPQTFRFNIAVPTTAIEDSVKIQLTVQGDKYSLDLQNVENNIKLPSGSGVSYALDWRQYAANTKYVITSKPFMCGLEDTVLTNLGKGLANLNQQRCSDGGFTNTGDCDETNRDTWFTAFNLATQAALIPYKLAIDVQALYGTVNYLVSIQLPDGSFPEKSWELTTHAFESGPKLTSYVLLTLLTSDENMPIKLKYADSIDKAVNYLLKNMDKLDLLTLTSLYYSLQVLDHKKRTEVYYILNKRSSKSALSKRWLHKSSDAWTEVDDLQNLLNGLLFNSDHVDILQTAHGLTKSLVEQFEQTSSQAKSKVISALADFAAAFSVQSPNLTVSFAPSGAPIEIVFLTKNNRFLLHQYEFHPKIRNVDFTAVGQGFVNLEIKYQYNLKEEEVQRQFALTVDVVPLDFEGWQLDICTNFKPTSDGIVISKIAVMDVSIPAGFKTTEYVRNFDKTAFSIVKKELKGGDLRITFDKLGQKSTCFTVPLYRSAFVGQDLVGSVLIYDQEKPHYRTQKTYTMPTYDASLMKW